MAFVSTYLEDDELEVECSIRGLDTSNKSRGDLERALDVYLSREKSGVDLAPKQVHMFGTIRSEINLCVDKITKLQQLASQGLREVNESILLQAYSRLIHVQGRLTRLYNSKPHSRIQLTKLLEEVSQLMGQVSAFNQLRDQSAGQTDALELLSPSSASVNRLISADADLAIGETVRLSNSERQELLQPNLNDSLSSLAAGQLLTDDQPPSQLSNLSSSAPPFISQKDFRH